MVREPESLWGTQAVKLIHEPYNGQVAWDWVATELFSTLFSKQGGYIVDTKRNILWHMRGQVSASYGVQLPEKRDREALSDTLYPFL